MTACFLDSSALVKRYLSEAGSDWIRRLLNVNANNTVVVAEITRVEVAAAIAARRRASGGISRQERDDAVDLLLKHFDTEYRIAPLDKDIVSKAVSLTQNYRLRGYDAVQLATALVVNGTLTTAGLDPLTFVTADNDLIKAANSEGLASENPNLHP